MPFTRERPYIVTETSETTELEAHSAFRVTASGITLTIADAAFDGCRAVVINASTGNITVKGGVSGLNGGSAALTLAAKEIAYLIYYSGWQTAFMTYGGQLSAPNAAAKTTHLVQKQEHDADITAAKALGIATGTLAISKGGTGATTAQAAANATVGAVSVDTATADSEYIVKATGSTVERMTVANFWTFLSAKVKALKVNNAVQADKATNADNAAKLNNKAESALSVSHAVSADTAANANNASNAAKLNNKAESALSVSYAASAGTATSATTATNATKLNNKAESALSVSYAANAGKLNNKAESALSVSYMKTEKSNLSEKKRPCIRLTASILPINGKLTCGNADSVQKNLQYKPFFCANTNKPLDKMREGG